MRNTFVFSLQLKRNSVINIWQPWSYITHFCVAPAKQNRRHTWWQALSKIEIFRQVRKELKVSHEKGENGKMNYDSSKLTNPWCTHQLSFIMQPHLGNTDNTFPLSILLNDWPKTIGTYFTIIVQLSLDLHTSCNISKHFMAVIGCKLQQLSCSYNLYR